MRLHRRLLVWVAPDALVAAIARAAAITDPARVAAILARLPRVPLLRAHLRRLNGLDRWAAFTHPEPPERLDPVLRRRKARVRGGGVEADFGVNEKGLGNRGEIERERDEAPSLEKKKTPDGSGV